MSRLTCHFYYLDNQDTRRNNQHLEHWMGSFSSKTPLNSSLTVPSPLPQILRRDVQFKRIEKKVIIEANNCYPLEEETGYGAMSIISASQPG